MKNLLGKILPKWLKKIIRRYSYLGRISAIVSNHIPRSICIDVGASYFPHGQWLLFLKSPKVQWLAIEPNEQNIAYIKSWDWPCSVSVSTTGLSQDGGSKTLYVTNVDSGSSLFPPKILGGMTHRIVNKDYFFPVTEKLIPTLTLVETIHKFDLDVPAPIFIKLDTQGSELSILKGAKSLFDQKLIVGVDMESTVLAQPVMDGSAKLWEACEYLEGHGFELLHIKPIYALPKNNNRRVNSRTYLNECDAIFAMRRDVALNLPVEYRVALFGFYLTNMFYEEASSLLQGDLGLLEYLNFQGCNTGKLTRMIG